MPEKSFSEVPKMQRDFFEKGNAAMQKSNWDYAIALYTQVLAAEPGFYECRESLRGAQMKKHANASTGFFKKMVGTASSSPLLAKAQLKLRTNPAEAMEACEQILNSDPNSVPAHKTLAEAAIALQFPKTAVLSLEIAFRASPKDINLADRLAEALAELGNLDRAETIYEELLRLKPHDTEISQKIKNLHARRTMRDGGYDAVGSENISYRDLLRNKEEAVSLEQANREVKDEDVADRLIAGHQQLLTAEPNNVKTLRSVAELNLQKKDFATALTYYERIAAMDGGADPTIERAISDIRSTLIDEQINKLNPALPEEAEQIGRLRTEQAANLLEDARKRVERFPTDLGLRFELGVLYFNLGKISEAIQELQKAQQNPNRRIQAMSYLAQAFSKRNMNDLAARTLQNALKEKLAFDTEKKELTYLLGVVLDKMNRKEEAIEQFKLIYETDIGYKDVSDRVDAYYADGGQ